jgi:hypothetical protein
MKKLSMLLLVAIGLLSCNNQNSNDNTTDASKKDGESKNDLVGTWTYDRVEKLGPNTNPDEVKEMEEKSREMSATFANDGSYFSMRKSNEGTDTVQTGRYELIDNGKYIVTHREYSSDTVELLKSSKNSFTIVTPEKDILVFKRIQ